MHIHMGMFVCRSIYQSGLTSRSCVTLRVLYHITANSATELFVRGLACLDHRKILVYYESTPAMACIVCTAAVM